MPELQDIFQQYGQSFRLQHKLPKNVHKAMYSIERCRTAALGGHMDICDKCGYTRISYNSCRNRHCPKCQTLAKERWIEAREYDLLNVRYFHIVFTIPDTLNGIAFQNQKTVYSILFKSVSETLAELARYKKYLGAKLGVTSILHTWSQNIMLHPHIHCIVPGGGLNCINQWVHSKKKFFIPVRVLSRKFRGKFLYFPASLFPDTRVIEVAEELRRSEGYVAECTQDPDSEAWLFSEYHCSVMRIAERIPCVCDQELQLIRTTFPDCQVDRVHWRLERGHSCGFRLRPAHGCA